MKQRVFKAKIRVSFVYYAVGVVWVLIGGFDLVYRSLVDGHPVSPVGMIFLSMSGAWFALGAALGVKERRRRKQKDGFNAG